MWNGKTHILKMLDPHEAMRNGTRELNSLPRVDLGLSIQAAAECGGRAITVEMLLLSRSALLSRLG